MVLPTKIPVACVGVLPNLGLALKFSFVPLHGFVAGPRGSLGRNYPLPNLQPWHPRALRLSPSLPAPYDLGSALTGYSPSTLTWQAGATGPFSPGARAHDTAHAAIGATGPASCGPTRAHYAILAPLGPSAYRGRLVRCPGCPLSDTHRSQPRSQPVTRTPAPLQRGFGPTLAPTAKRPPFCKFV